MDLIANRFLNDPFAGFWRLCDANNVIVPDALAKRDLVGIPLPGRCSNVEQLSGFFNNQPADEGFYTAIASLEVEENMDLPGAVRLNLPVSRTQDGDLTYVSDNRLRPMTNLAVVASVSSGSGAVDAVTSMLGQAVAEDRTRNVFSMDMYFPRNST